LNKGTGTGIIPVAIFELRSYTRNVMLTAML